MCPHIGDVQMSQIRLNRDTAVAQNLVVVCKERSRIIL